MLVLCDLDKTILNTNYHYTDDRLVIAIAAAQKCGWVIGLSSDSPLPVMMRHRQALGMNGPIIAERGAVVYLPGRSTPTVSTGTASTGFFVSLRDQIVWNIVDRGFMAIYADPTAIIANKMIRVVDSTDVLLVNAHRSYSLHLAPRRIKPDGSYESCPDMLELVVDTARHLLAQTPPNFEIEWDINKDYCLLILHAATSIKRVGTEVVMRELEYDRAVMIGDSINDNVNMQNVEQWAVGNASDAYKALCSRVATRDISQGVMELLGFFD